MAVPFFYYYFKAISNFKSVSAIFQSNSHSLMHIFNVLQTIYNESIKLMLAVSNLCSQLDIYV